MEKLNSYVGMAENDYLYSKAMMPVGDTIGNFNNIAALCAQSAENILKLL